MRSALTSMAAAAALALGTLAGSPALAAKGGGGGGGGGGHMGGGGGGMAIGGGHMGGGGFGGAAIRGGGMGPAFRAGPTVGTGPQRFSGQRFSGPARAQAWNGNRGYWDRDRRHFRRGAFFGFAAGYPWWDYGYSDSCWAWNGVEWVYTCYPYPYY